MSKYKLIKMGDTSEFSHKILKEGVIKFSEISGDDNKLHIDEVYDQ
jgi:3-oxoacyl-[acyl-carrier protein] reductase